MDNIYVNLDGMMKVHLHMNLQSNIIHQYLKFNFIQVLIKIPAMKVLEFQSITFNLLLKHYFF